MSPSGNQFSCPPGSTILSAGLGAGVALPFGCANGSCGSCRARIIDGEVEVVRFHDYTLSHADKLSGYCLLCASAARGDVVVEVTEASSVTDVPKQTLKAKRCQLLTRHGVLIVRFKFIRGKAFRFLPGQWAELCFEDDFRIDLPIASCPCDAQVVEFHIPENHANTGLTGRIQDMSSNARVVISGPHGDFTVSEDDATAKIFIAVGEGFASIQGLVEHVINLELETDCRLIWQASDTVERYFDNLCRSWADALDNFQYQPVSAGASLIDIIDAELKRMAGICCQKLSEAKTPD